MSGTIFPVCVTKDYLLGKGKAIPLQALTGPEGPGD
jgi:hypothetical protein